MDYELEIRQKYRFVLVRTPHEIILQEDLKQLFPHLIHFKTAGYQQEYGENVLPFDSSDFIASHLLLCEKNKNIPVLGFKSVTLKKCDDYRISFPMLAMLDDTKNSNSAAKLHINNILDEYRAEGKSESIAYNGSFTINPSLREDKVLMKSLWDVTFSLLTNYYMEYNIDHVLAVCATKFKVHEKKEKLGCNYISSGKLNLGAYNCKSLFGAHLIPMELKDVKTKGLISSEKFKDMWKNKLVIQKNHIKTDIKIAA
jgi:hypothetical protein